MTAHQQLKPAIDMARMNGVRFPNESGEYRRARDAISSARNRYRWG